MRYKKLIVRSDNAQLDFIKPAPASTQIPSWYKSLKAVDDEVMDMTMKKCVPVLDGFTTGYILRTSVDIMYNSETESFSHNGITDEISFHPDFQMGDMEVGDHLSRHVYKWTNHFYLKTPKGYSTLFVHPLNRTDLPFYSLNAVVDTDDFPLTVQFPFLIKKDFNGLIPAGTPIMQAIPFKRDDWKMSFPKENESYEYEHFWNWFEPPMAKYKRFFWKKKRYQ